MVDWNRVGEQATCQMLEASGGTAAAIAAGSAITGQIWGVVGGGVGLLAATAVSNYIGCGDPPNPNVPNNGAYSGCWKVAGNGCMDVNAVDVDGDRFQFVQARQWLGSTLVEPYPNGQPKQIFRYIDCDGNEQENDTDGTYRFIGTPYPDSTCDGDTPPPLPPIPPVPVPDPDGGSCVFNVKVVDAYINGSGGMSIKYESCPSGDGCPLTECNYFWYHGDGTTQPTPPTPPTPEPLPPRPEPQPNYEPILDDIKECACAEPPEPPNPDFPVDLPSWSEEFKAVCNLDPQGNPEEVTFNSASASKASEALSALANNQQLLIKVMQQALNWKTPICSTTPTPVTGHLVSIHFESLETSPNGKCRLRKLFRYRSQSSRTLAQIASYWEGFQWQAGPFVVGHTDAAWGTVQVWAESVAEGQRVIRKAGTEAGVDPDTSGEWRTGSSDDPRYGMPGTMRIQRLEDGDWITSRRGPNGLPLYTVDP